jgi:hypothetical protein
MSTYQERLRHRYAVLAGVFLVVLGVLFIRLWSMQVLSGDEFAAAAENNRVRDDRGGGAARPDPRPQRRAPRDEPLDSRGHGRSDRERRRRPSLPALRGARHAVRGGSRARLVSEGGAAQATSRRAGRADARRSLSRRASDRLPGVDVSIVPVREYPHAALAAHVLGYTGEISESQLQETDMSDYTYGDIVGRSGAERQYESVLQGVKGYQRVEVDAMGSPRRVIEEAEPVAGRDVVLTIDVAVQAVAEQALLDALADARADEFPNARAGAAVALDIRTGEVLAMASMPTYDPSSFTGGISQAEWDRLNDKDSEYPLNNRAIQAGYPPASTFKVVTALAGLEHGVTSTGSTYYCSGLWTGMGEQWGKRCWNRTGHGSIGFTGGMAHSCDTVYYEIGHELHKRGNEELQEWSRQFGLGATLGIDLPGEVAGTRSGRRVEGRVQPQLSRVPDSGSRGHGQHLDRSGRYAHTPSADGGGVRGLGNDGPSCGRTSSRRSSTPRRAGAHVRARGRSRDRGVRSEPAGDPRLTCRRDHEGHRCERVPGFERPSRVRRVPQRSTVVMTTRGSRRTLQPKTPATRWRSFWSRAGTEGRSPLPLPARSSRSCSASRSTTSRPRTGRGDPTVTTRIDTLRKWVNLPLVIVVTLLLAYGALWSTRRPLASAPVPRCSSASCSASLLAWPHGDRVSDRLSANSKDGSARSSCSTRC